MNINQWDGYGNITCSDQSNRADAKCIHNGQEALDYLGLKKENIMLDISILLALTVGFRILSFLFLLRKAYKRP